MTNPTSESAKPVAEAAAYKWAYEYLQSRMESIGRDGWAHDCDGEIEDRIRAAPIAQTADALDAERWRALRGACESLIAASEEYDFDDGIGVGILQDAWDEFQTAVDAAEIDPEPDALAIMKTAIAAIQREGKMK